MDHNLSPRDRMIEWNSWQQYADDVQRSSPNKSVSVIVPAHTSQDMLDLCLNSLMAQDYPDHLLEVIVVDHKSDEKLVLSEGVERTRLYRYDEGDGPGAARAYGASKANGEIFLFIDSDIIASPDMVNNYVRWPGFDSRFIGLGFRDFIDPDLTIHTELLNAIKFKRLAQYFLPSMQVEGQGWINQFLERSQQNNLWRDDLWIVVVGAGLSVHRDFYDWAGGFHDFEVHGVEDTEFGWRLFNSGGVIVPDSAAVGYHMGLRSISKNRDLINGRRIGTLANLIPNTRYRPPLLGRRWAVPKVTANVIVDFDTSESDVIGTVNDLLCCGEGDIEVAINYSHDWVGERNTVDSHFDAESRVSIQRLKPDSEGEISFNKRSRYFLNVKAGIRLSEDLYRALEMQLLSENMGVLSIVAGSDVVSIEFGWVHALSRSLYSADSWSSVRQVLAATYGHKWLPHGDLEGHSSLGASSVELQGGRYRLRVNK